MEEKQMKNLFRKLINDENSVFFSSDRINKTLLNKGRKSSYEKDKVFYNLLKNVDDKNIIYDENENRVPFYTPFIPQKKILIDQHFILLMDHFNFFMLMLHF